MKITFLPAFSLIVFSAFAIGCTGSQKATNSENFGHYPQDTTIRQSLFSDKASTITEDNIAKILDGQYKLPQKLRVAIIRLETETKPRNYFEPWYDEGAMKTRQAYLDKFMDWLKRSERVTMVSTVPEMLLPASPGFTTLREAAVRMQADIVIAYAIRSDLYSKFKLFDKPDIKAFATTQLIVLDVRTGLIPFSLVVTKDALSERKKQEMDNNEAAARVQHEAVLLTIDELGKRMGEFLQKG